MPVYLDNNPQLPGLETVGVKYDEDKPCYTLIPPNSLRGMADVLTFGAKKYKAESWKTVPEAQKRYLDALYRHLEAYRSGELVDEETGLHHMSHIMCNAAFVMWFDETPQKSR